MVFPALTVHASYAIETATKAFYQQFELLPVEDRYAYFADCIRDEKLAVDTKRLAFKEFANTAIAMNLTESAILVVDSVLNKSVSGSDVYQAAFLANAKLLFNSDERGKVETMFQTAIDFNWRMEPKKPTHWLYIDCLNDARQYWKSAIVEYECIAKPDSWITEDDAHFLRLYRWLILEKSQKRDEANWKTISNVIKTNENSILSEIAQAFLSASENRAAEAIGRLNETERSCIDDPNMPDAKEAIQHSPLQVRRYVYHRES